MFNLFTLLSVFVSIAFAVDELPTLNIDGFSWAESLAFDGLGGMFVSDAVLGQFFKIELCNDGKEYCKEVYLDEGISQFGGIQVQSDGLIVYVGVTFDDKSQGIISAPTSNAEGKYTIIAKTPNQPNGLAFDEKMNVLFYTDEGTGSEEGGTVCSVNMNNGQQIVLKDQVSGADGCYFDEVTRKLFIGELFSKKILVFDIIDATTTKLLDTYIGLNEALGHKDMLDDIVLVNNTSNPIENTQLFGCDWTGKSIQQFSLDGSIVSKVSLPDSLELYQPTCVRWGIGPGFDKNSIYITEGGGITKHQDNRRVIQIKMN